MSSALKDNRRIAKNTLMLYIRMLLIMVVSLYTSRIILGVLGVEDFGIYNVVGGVVAMVSFLNSTLSSTCQRYFSYEIGRGNQEGISILFRLNLTVYLYFILVVIFFAETIGLWFVNNCLVIPQDRIVAMNWTYQFSILTFIVSSFSIPYNALIISHEQMSVYAYISIIEVLLRLGIVFLLSLGDVDRLILYAVLLFLSTSCITLFYYVYCKCKYPESHYSYLWKSDKIREVASYSGWHLIGAVSVIVRNQGVNVLLNSFFNPVVNGARAIAFQVSVAVDSLTNSFFVAVKPQIYKLYGANELNQMYILLSRSSKICFLRVAILAYPILMNMEFVLNLWLNQIPDYTVLFTQLVLINALIDSVNGPAIAAALATGRIKKFEIITGGLMILNLPMSYILLFWGCAPEVTMIVSIVLSLVTIIIRSFILEKLMGYKVVDYMANVFFPLLMIGLLSFIFVYFIGKCIPNAVIHFFVTSIVAVLLLSIFTFFIALTSSERSTTKKYILRGVDKLFH